MEKLREYQAVIYNVGHAIKLLEVGVRELGENGGFNKYECKIIDGLVGTTILVSEKLEKLSEEIEQELRNNGSSIKQ
ncbi:MAG: hypothetical protein Q3988_05595 [Gemella sp.]|nr:hypothetical protein [Gemella sp.]